MHPVFHIIPYSALYQKKTTANMKMSFYIVSIIRLKGISFPNLYLMPLYFKIIYFGKNYKNTFHEILFSWNQFRNVKIGMKDGNI